MMGRDVCTLGVRAVSSRGRYPFTERKVELLAMLGGEAAFSVGAWHDNPGTAGGPLGLVREALTAEDLEGRTVVDAVRERTRLAGAEGMLNPASRDCGIGQINIPWSQVGTPVELDLRTESTDPKLYLPVAQHNLSEWANLYVEPWAFPDGKREMRQWQASVAYRTGWSLFGPAWVGSHVTPGTWVQTGRYLPKAIRAVANWWIVERGMDPYDALALAERLAQTYRVPMSTTYWLDVDPGDPQTHKLVFWHYPPKPTEPPAADSPYPTRNDGRSYLSVLASHA